MSVKRKGIFFALGGILLVLALLWVAPAHVIKWGIESYGSEALGARVEVDSVKFSWLDTELIIAGLQVANPDEPSQNLLTVDHLATAFDLGQLLDKKVYLDALLIDGVALDTTRLNSGELPADDETKKNTLPMLDMALVDTDQLIAKEKVIYGQRVKAYQQHIKDKQARVQKNIDQLPNQNKINDYKARIKQLKKSKGPMGALSAFRELDKLNKEIKRELNKIKAVEASVKHEYAQFQQELSVIKGLPNKSVAEIINTLGIDESLLAQAGQQLLEGKVRQWIDQGYTAYHMVVGEKADGAELIAGSTNKTVPDFLVKLTTLSGRFTHGEHAGSIEGTITNITEAPQLVAEPIMVDIKTTGDTLGSINLLGEIDHRTKGQERDTLQLKMDETVLNGYMLADNPDLTLQLNKAMLALASKVTLTQFSHIELELKSLFSEVDFAVSGDDKEKASETLTAISEALKDLSFVRLDGIAKGEIQTPDLSFETNLDAILESALSGMVKGKLKKIEREVKEKLVSSMDAQLKPATQSLNDFGLLSMNVDTVRVELERILKSGF